MTQNRNQLLDVAKAVAILLVILGHAVQQCSGFDDRAVLDLWIERFLISFHMPLFMLISGYLFYYSLQRHSENAIVSGRLKMFVWPILTMAVLHHLRGHISHFDVYTFFADFPLSLFNSLWFFWAIAIITILMCLVHRFFNDSVWGYAAAIVTTLLVPDMYPLRAYVHLLPTFFVGYIFAKHSKFLIGGGKSSAFYVTLLAVSIIAFFLLLRGFGRDDMIYFSRYSLIGSSDILGDVARDLFRFVIGIVGGVMVLQFLYVLMRYNIVNEKVISCLVKVGRMTFGIYVFQDLMLLLLNPLSSHLNGDYYVFNSAVSFVIIVIMSILLTHWSERNRLLGILFLGKNF